MALFGPKDSLPPGWKFRPMKPGDVATVLKIIEETDEDDRDWAEQTYQERGLDNQFVLCVGNLVAGVTGISFALGTRDTYWISWTYLAKQYHGQGKGGEMLRCLISRLNRMKARKAFVSVSDYRDLEDTSGVYENALACYQSVGFTVEVTHRDFYAPGENQFILGLTLQQGGLGRVDSAAPTAQASTRNIELSGVGEIDETEGTFLVGWDYNADGPPVEASHFQEMIVSARAAGARSLMASFPSDHVHVLGPLAQAGFSEAGKLLDFYAEGVHEVRYASKF